MHIHEIAQITHLTPATIRYYERLGLLDGRCVTRQMNGYRVYTTGAIERLLHFKKARTSGLTIAEIKRLTDASDSGKLTNQERCIFLRDKINDLSQKIALFQEIQEGFETQLQTLSTKREHSN